MFKLIELTIITFFVLFSFFSVEAQVYNSVTKNNYEDCKEYAKECSYYPSRINIDILVSKVRRLVGKVKAETLIDTHHLDGETYIKNIDGVIEFSSVSESCKLGSKFVNCRDLIEYWLIKEDEETKVKSLRTFDVRVVIYQYNTIREKEVLLGFGGSSSSSTIGQSEVNTLSDDGASIGSVTSNVRPARTILELASTGENLGPLFTQNLGDLTSNILSLNLNLGHLGNYISTYNSFAVELKANKYRSIDIEAKNVYANSTSQNKVKEEVGLFLSGEIKPNGENPKHIQFTKGNIKYGRSADEGSIDSTSFSLTTQLNLAKWTTFNLDIELGKPKMLFDINTVELSQEKGFGFLFFKNIDVAKHINLVGVMYVTEKKFSLENPEKSVVLKSEVNNLEQEETVSFEVEGLKQSVAMAPKIKNINFKDIFSRDSLKIYFDPILASTLGTNIEDLSKKTKGTSSQGYLVKPYKLRLNSKKLSERDLSLMVRIEVAKNSPVALMGQSGIDIISVRQLIENGYYLGFTPKSSSVFWNPLRVKLKISLDQGQFFNKADWTESSKYNQVIYNMFHYGAISHKDGMGLDFDKYNHIPWR